MLTAFLDSKASFAIAALFVTWLALVLLMLVIGNLHVRLQSLEQKERTAKHGQPYAHLLGKQLPELLGDVIGQPQPQILLFLSSVCKSCEQVLDELKASSWTVPAAIVWTDRPPSPLPVLPRHTLVLDNGPRISAEFRIGITPFVLVISKNGRVIKASPINNLKSLGELVNGSADFPLDNSHKDPFKELSL